MWFVNIQEVERTSEKVRIQSLNIDELRQQMETAEDAVLRINLQQRQCDEPSERLKQRASAAEARLERLAMERHCLLVYAVVSPVSIQTQSLALESSQSRLPLLRPTILLAVKAIVIYHASVFITFVAVFLFNNNNNNRFTPFNPG